MAVRLVRFLDDRSRAPEPYEWRRWARFGVIAVLLISTVSAVVLWFAIPMPTASVNVKWTSGLSGAERMALERRFHLTQGQPRDGNTWQYALEDYSSENIRALVEHPAVEDTFRLNRVVFRPDPLPPNRTWRVARDAVLMGTAGSLLLLLARRASRRRSRVLLALLGAVLVGWFAYIRDMDLRVDETSHYHQIVHIVHPDQPVDPALLIHSVIPGYHYVLASLAVLFNTTAIPHIRLLSFAFSLLALMVFHLVARRVSHDEWSASLRTINYGLFPAMFAYQLLIYNDHLALLLVLTGLLLLMKGKYLWSGVAMTLSLLVRQTHIIWLAFFWFVIWYDAYHHSLKTSAIVSLLKGTWTFVLGALLFVAFVIVNHGVSMGDVEMQPSFTLHAGNVFFFLFLVGTLFLPLHVANGRRIWQYLRSSKGRYLLAGVAATAVIYALTFENTHPYNTQWGDYFVRNRLLIYAASSPLHKAVFFLPVALAVMSLTVTVFTQQSFYFLYPATLLCLVPSWLIEQRYSIVPLSLLMLFKKDESRWAVWTNVALSFLLSSFLLWGIKTGALFP